MSEYDNSNRLALWLNDKREKQTQPHVKGSCDASGVEYWASGWFAKDLDENDAKSLMGIIQRHNQNSKTPFLSISIQPKEQHNQQSAPPVRQPGSAAQGNDFDDDLPF